MKYLILSLKWSPSKLTGFAVWWMPNDNGYTEDINQAGRYTQDQVKRKASYYNDKEETLAVPESEVILRARDVRLAKLSDFWVGGKEI